MSEPAAKFIGIIKFFRDEQKLDALVNGCFYCNTPEFYRQNNYEGVSDKFESCYFSYNSIRDNEPLKLKVNGVTLNNVSRMIIHNPGDGDAWMHCWYALWFPKDQAELDEMNVNIERMKSEFGNQYAFIHANEIKDFVNHLEKFTDKPIFCKEVEYSPEQGKWGTFCKSLSYAYQREYRFSIGECEPHIMKEYVVTSPNGFSNIILKNPKLELQHSLTSQVLLEISVD